MNTKFQPNVGKDENSFENQDKFKNALYPSVSTTGLKKKGELSKQGFFKISGDSKTTSALETVGETEEVANTIAFLTSFH